MSSKVIFDLTIDDDDEQEREENELEVLTFGPDEEDEDEEQSPEIISIDDSHTEPTPARPISHPFSIKLPDIEIKKHRLGNGEYISIGDVVELRDVSERRPNDRISGDFLCVRQIIFNAATDETRLHGYRLRRCKYLRPQFDDKLNELFVVINAREEDARAPLDQGIEEIAVTDVIRKRECYFRDDDYTHFSDRNISIEVPARIQTLNEARTYVFHYGSLFCRFVNIVYVNANGKSYAGEVRKIYKRECKDFSSSTRDQLKSNMKRTLATEFNDDCVIIEPEQKSSLVSPPSDSREIPGQSQSRTRPNLPKIPEKYTYGDVFCGGGGASEGARQAGVIVKYGLDLDATALEGYERNFPEAISLLMNAHDFPSFEDSGLLWTDFVHISFVCKYFSTNKTREGKNDQANMETLYTVGPILASRKPRISIIEQAFGFLTKRKHRLHFRTLINDILTAGYNLRYKIHDCSQFGVPQRRIRLFFICARKGIPLPPFPSPTNGPTGSGLKRFVSVADALHPLMIPGAVRPDDKYHQPHKMKVCNATPYDPETSFLKGCITTSGGDNHHFSGKSKYTARQLSLFQGFPPGFHFNGSCTKAIETIGNAVPVNMEKSTIEICAQTLEAFDHGLIEPEEDIADLYETLKRKGITIPPNTPPRRSFLDGSIHADSKPSQYRYLCRLKKNPAKLTSESTPVNKQSLFSRTQKIAPLPQRKREHRPSSFHFGLIDEGDDDYNYELPTPSRRPRKRKRGEENDMTDAEKLVCAQALGEVIELE